MPTEVYRSNASEADFRVWRHAVCSPSKNILLYSPDTDVYNIGLKFAGLAHKEFIVQLNVIHAEDKQYLHLSNFVNSLCSDPDLACLDKDSLPVTFQVLFLATGCDYISYFKSIGKATFWNVFYQHATFITGQRMPGNLHQINTQGFYSFIRLVGTVYFKKHISRFISRYNYESPIHLYNSFDPTLSDEMRHQSWLQSIREVVSERITSEEERVPTYTSLWRHWLRTCWCLQLWHASSQEDMYKDLPPPETSGWLQLSDGSYIIDWEDKGVQGEIQSTIDYLIRGCACKTGCKTKRCKCKKKGTHCGPGCECQGCANVPLSGPQDLSSDEETDDVLSTCSSTCSCSEGENEETEETVTEEEFDTEVITMEETLFDQVDIL